MIELKKFPICHARSSGVKRDEQITGKPERGYEHHASYLERSLQDSFSPDHPFTMLLREHWRDEEADELVDGVLTEVGFSFCKLGDVGAEILAEFLVSNETVTSVVLNSCKIGPRGLTAIFEALKRNRTVLLLDLSNNPTTSWNEADCLEQCFSQNVSLIHLVVSNNGWHHMFDTIYNFSQIRNAILVPAAARRAALFLIGIRQSSNREGMGYLGMHDKNVIMKIAVEIWATRKDPIWIRAVSSDNHENARVIEGEDEFDSSGSH